VVACWESMGAAAGVRVFVLDMLCRIACDQCDVSDNN
jgi:hypothetical protein